MNTRYSRHLGQFFGKCLIQNNGSSGNRVSAVNRNPCTRSNQIGMTLIEIMIVIAIVGGLMAVLGKNVVSYLDKSRVQNAKIQIKEISKSLDMYYADCGSFPTTEQGLAALTQSPGESCPNWGPEPYRKKEDRDPWGAGFLYESDSSTYIVRSLGKGGKEGGDAYEKDISSEEL